ncbi:hypothetical protein QCN29_21190 [Streptomyces sp. HNM0663]|uniref:Uncharacterized protein n=1 Tax=Streptomyces chengmaiensis TaxID=3040919 RepID=A0ABT6HRC2_9ACTN|nr:hypothetical protein [Streptomyces chengmaiensis]MDH2391251.1 hypothetical protein [Streptomyces chengmaiensis]
MTDLICRIAVWLRLVFAPGTGGRRAGARPIVPAARPQEACPAARSADGQGERFGPAGGWSLRPRSPYGMNEPLDGGAVALVRPYLIEHERRQERARQQRRRMTLVLAADFGIDLDTRVLHGAGVAR